MVLRESIDKIGFVMPMTRDTHAAQHPFGIHPGAHHAWYEL